jgi:hypothetical protein
MLLDKSVQTKFQIIYASACQPQYQIHSQRGMVSDCNAASGVVHDGQLSRKLIVRFWTLGSGRSLQPASCSKALVPSPNHPSCCGGCAAKGVRRMYLDHCIQPMLAHLNNGKYLRND